jgi:hypothetical protein
VRKRFVGGLRLNRGRDGRRAPGVDQAIETAREYQPEKAKAPGETVSPAMAKPFCNALSWPLAA